MIVQVYRGKLKEKYGGGEVAVKVQRPNVLCQVALDLYVMRFLAGTVVKSWQSVRWFFCTSLVVHFHPQSIVSGQPLNCAVDGLHVLNSCSRYAHLPLYLAALLRLHVSVLLPESNRLSWTA